MSAQNRATMTYQLALWRDVKVVWSEVGRIGVWGVVSESFQSYFLFRIEENVTLFQNCVSYAIR